jgi:protein-S-isoprenylcysteine O-methyltransferase Ste14
MELKIPPVALVLIFAVVQGLLAHFVPSLTFFVSFRVPFAVALATVGAAVPIAAVLAFRTANTTVDPTRPEATSSMVIRGVYRLSRNPMYLGFLLLLASVAVVLMNALAFVLLPIFVAYMNRFQIVPEERMLSAKFGTEFESYCQTPRLPELFQVGTLVAPNASAAGTFVPR